MSIAALPQYALLHFSGPDAQSFLHNQLTCDVLALQAGHATYGGYCTPKGRLLATFLLWPDAGGYALLLPAVLAGSVLKRLAMYILRSKVKAEDRTPGSALVGIDGADASSQVTAFGGSVPARTPGVTQAGEIGTVALPGSRFLLLLPAEQAASIAAAAAGAWELGDIAAGIPFIVPATQEEFVPQMVNLDLIGALSYTKGCYPGQEIVARTHYLGRLKQRMYRARLAAPASPGDKLYCTELGDQAAGRIVSGAAVGGGYEVLAVLQTANARSAQYHLGSLQGPALELLPLPYAVD